METRLACQKAGFFIWKINLYKTCYLKLDKLQYNKGGFEMGKRVSYYLPEELVERLQRASKKTDVPQSKLVIRALETELKKYEK